MTFPVGKPVDFIFYGRAVAGTKTLYAALEHWRFFKSLFKLSMYILVSIGDPATELFFNWLGVSERKLGRMLVSWLFSHFGIIQRAAIYSWWRSDRKSTRLNSSHQIISYAV